MGYIRHNAIICTSWNSTVIELAASKAKELGLPVSDVVKSPVNRIHSCLIAPDGSKEGWGNSGAGDDAREKFRQWTKSLRYEDDSSPLCWVEVAYGSDDRDATICAHEWEGVQREVAAVRAGQQEGK